MSDWNYNWTGLIWECIFFPSRTPYISSWGCTPQFQIGIEDLLQLNLENWLQASSLRQTLLPLLDTFSLYMNLLTIVSSRLDQATVYVSPIIFDDLQTYMALRVHHSYFVFRNSFLPIVHVVSLIPRDVKFGRTAHLQTVGDIKNIEAFNASWWPTMNLYFFLSFG